MARRKTMSMERAEALAEMYKTLGDPTRLRLLSAISAQERCVHELTELLELEQSAVSHQLRKLKDRDLVKGRKEGRHVYYALADDHVKTLLHVGLEHAAHGRKR